MLPLKALSRLFQHKSMLRIRTCQFFVRIDTNTTKYVYFDVLRIRYEQSRIEVFYFVWIRYEHDEIRLFRRASDKIRTRQNAETMH